MSELGIWLKTLMQLNQKQNGNKTMANQMQKKKNNNIVMHVIILPTEKQYKPFHINPNTTLLPHCAIFGSVT